MYDLTGKYPKPERYGLSSQLQRSATSVANNLAEGFSRYSKKEKTRFYKIAKGSAYECIPALTISYRHKYIEKDDFDEMYQECFEISRRIAGIINSVNNRNMKR
jgi:four helix bundle protein